MTDKVQKIREEIEKIKTAHSSIDLKESNPDVLVVQVCTNLLSFIDSMQEEPKTDWLQELQKRLDSLSKEDFKNVMAKYSRYGEEEPVNKVDVDAAMAEVEAKAKTFTESHKGESSDKILAQMRGEEPVSEDLKKASKEWLEPQLDKSYVSYGEGKMMELTHFDGYAMLDAIEFGAKWQEQKDMVIFNELAELANHQDGYYALEKIQMRLNGIINED